MKKLLSLMLVTVMLLTVMPGLTVSAESGGSWNTAFSDVPREHWAYDIIMELTEKGVINGMGDGTFQPGGLVTREQFMKLLVCALGYDEDPVSNVAMPEIDGTGYPGKYILAGLKHGIFNLSDEPVFKLGEDVTRSVAVTWIMNGIGVDTDVKNIFPDITEPELAHDAAIANKLGLVSGYEDGSFRPERTLTRAEAAALTKRVMDYISEKFSLREDAKNEILLRDNVVIGESTLTSNVPVDADERANTVTFRYPDDMLKKLERGEILFISPCDNFPSGLLGKALDVASAKNGVTIKFSQPELWEVVEAMDISIYAAPTMDSFADDGDLRAVKVGGYAAPDEKNGFNVDFTGDKEVTFEVKGKKVVLDAGAKSGATVTYKTPGFDKKTGLYASLDMGVLVKVDVQLESSALDVKVFNASADIITNINAVAGYNVSGSKEFVYKLPTETIPVAGILNVVIESNLVAGAKGSFSIEATANLENNLGMSFDLEDGLETHNKTDADAGLKVDAEGSLEFGPRENVKLTLCGIKIPIINKTLFDGVALLKADADFGVGIKGTLTSDLSAHLTNDGLTFNESDEDERHVCYVCVEGNGYTFFRGDIGLGDDVADILKKVTDKKFSREFSLPKDTFLFWHLSSGEGYTDEFELQKCPHYGYKTTVTVVDDAGAVIPGAAVTLNGKTYTTGADGKITTYLAKGRYGVTAEADGYEPGTDSVYVNNSATGTKVVLKALNREYVRINISGGVVGNALFYYKNGGIYRRYNGQTKKITDSNGYDFITNGKDLYYVGENCAVYRINVDGTNKQLLYYIDIPDYLLEWSGLSRTDFASAVYLDALYDNKLFYAIGIDSGIEYFAVMDLETGNIVLKKDDLWEADTFLSGDTEQSGQYLIGVNFGGDTGGPAPIMMLDMKSLTVYGNLPILPNYSVLQFSGSGFYYWNNVFTNNYKSLTAELRYYNFETKQDYQVFNVGTVSSSDMFYMSEDIAVYSVNGKVYARELHSGETYSLGTVSGIYFVNEDSGKYYFRASNTVYEYADGKLTSLKTINNRDSCYVLNGEVITW